MTGSWHNKLSNFKKRSFLMAILIDDLTLPEGIDNSASKDINRPFLSGHCAMKRWNREIDIQRNNIPLNRFRLLNLINIDLMQSRIGDLEEMQKRLILEIILTFYPE